MATWDGWTHEDILAALAEIFGTGWQKDTTKLAAIENLIASAWLTVRVMAATGDAADPADPTSVPTAVNQLWYLASVWMCGSAIAPETPLIPLYFDLYRSLLNTILKQRLAGEGTYSYDSGGEEPPP